MPYMIMPNARLNKSLMGQFSNKVSRGALKESLPLAGSGQRPSFERSCVLLGVGVMRVISGVIITHVPGVED